MMFLVNVGVTPPPRSQTRDNCRVPLSETQFFRIPPKDLQDITNTHNPFEIKTFKSVYDYINKI